MKLQKIIQTATVAVFALALGACADSGGSKASGSSNPPLGARPDGSVVKSVFKMQMSADASGVHLTDVSGNPANFPVTVVNGPNTSMTISTAKVVVPPITSAPLTFGSLFFTALQDNNVRVCGTSGTDHCGSAVIRIYTVGTPGAGFWNTADSYGMPITTNLTGGPVQTIGLNVAGAATIESSALRPDQNVVHLSDFAVPPEFTINTDFSNAGAGTYSTTIVVEYALLP